MLTKYKITYKILATCLSFFLVAGNANVLADGTGKLSDRYGTDSNVITDTETVARYAAVYQSYSDRGYTAAGGPDATINLSATVGGSAPLFGEGFAGDNSNALIWDKSEASFSWNFSVESTGLYNLQIEYCSRGDNVAYIQRSVLIDGKLPFLQAQGIIFAKTYIEDGKVVKNNVGDDVRPQMTEQYRWNAWMTETSASVGNVPFQYFLEAGSHTLTLEFGQGKIAIRSVKFVPVTESASYAEVKAAYSRNGYTEYKGESLTLQAEDADTRSNSALRREYNNDPSSEPFEFGYRRLNVIGSDAWNTAGQSISWKIIAPETGLYKISLRVLQNWNDGLPSVRRIAVDGKIPFREFEGYTFKYANDWQLETLGDGQNPYLVYLTKGQHELKMTVVSDYVGKVSEILTETITDMMDFYSEIRKITGSSPDINYDYQYERVVPDLSSKLTGIRDKIKSVINELNQAAGKRPSMVSNFERILNLFDNLIKSPFNITKNLDSMYDYSIDIGTWINSLSSMPLTIDYFVVSSPQSNITMKKTSLIDSLKNFAMSFLTSFSKDYENVGSTGSNIDVKEPLNVWVARNSEWVEIMKDLTNEQFTKNTGIGVKFNTVPPGQLSTGGVNTLLLSIISGKSPDVISGVDVATPFEFAIRGSVYDLTKFDDYSAVSSRFYPEISVPVTYEKGIYAVPETMNFMVMFYRRDIFAKLKLALPETWDSLYRKTLPVLSQNNMNFFYNNGYNLFAFQHNAKFYSDDGKTSELNSENAYQAFKEWVELYTQYEVPLTANFFSRFRSGEIPVGIGVLSDYVLFQSAAPELLNKWDIAEVPGVLQADGSVSHTASMIGDTYCAIVNKSLKKDSAWKFIKWWTSAETQSSYALTVESLLGFTARYCSANTEAFSELPWLPGQAEIITTSLKNAKQRPAILGGSYTDRHIANAQNRVIMNGMAPRDSLRIMVKDINRELLTKRVEYGKN